MENGDITIKEVEIYYISIMLELALKLDMSL